MRRALRLLALLAILLAPPAAARMVTDSAGRMVELPDRVERVFAAGPPATVALYALAPETMVGWVRPFRGGEADYVAAPYRDLPVTGRLTGRGGDVNLEVLLATRPDLILDLGSVAPTYVSLADRVQAQTGIPYILIDGTFENTARSLRLLGDILGLAGRAAELAAYAQATFARVDEVLARVPPDRRPRAYLARGPDGLETGLQGSINTEILERVGALNVAAAPGQQGIARVSPEQVLRWDPQVIVTWDRASFGAVLDDPLWRNIEAVREGRVYLSPDEPFGWIDRPPALNRLLGMAWLLHVLYPREAALDLRAETRRFYELFYHVDLTPAQLDHLLEGAGG